MERELLLLGILRTQETHGYQLNEVISGHLAMNVHLKKASAYDLLKKMTDDGWITFHEERAGNRPQRRVYAITPAGEAAFQRMLRECLSSYKPAEFAGDIGLAFLDLLPPDEALGLLKRRRAAIQALLTGMSSAKAEHPGSMQLVVEHQIRHLTTELEWADEVIGRVADKYRR